MPAMSNNRSEKGRLGEEYAARLLEREGYRILSRNFHTRYGEIDLIAQKGEILAFIEVKTRAADSFSRPAAAVSRQKQSRIILAAEGYLQRFPTALQPRFDVVEVVTEKAREFRVRGAEHLEGAFDQTMTERS